MVGHGVEICDAQNKLQNYNYYINTAVVGHTSNTRKSSLPLLPLRPPSDPEEIVPPSPSPTPSDPEQDIHAIYYY